MDSELLGSLIDQLAGALELYARQWVEPPEDVVQEAFVKLAALSPPPRNPAAWLFKTVRNAAINAGIAKLRRRKHETRAAIAATAWFETRPSGPREAAVDPESAQVALAGLSAKQREIIVAHVWGGLTFEQIADVAGVSASSAHRIYQSGLKTLRERLGVPCRTNPSRPIPN